MASPPARNAATSCDGLPPNRYNLLVEFAVRHADFQRAEVSSMLDLHGIVCNDDDDNACHMIPLPSHNTQGPHRPFCILSFPPSAHGERYQLKDDDPEASHLDDSNLNIGPILCRCTLVRSVVELWGMGESTPSCAKSVQCWVQDDAVGRHVFAKRSNPKHSWKVTVHTLGAKFSRQEQDAMRLQFSFLKLAGPVQMVEPSNDFLLIREVELDDRGCPVYPRHGLRQGGKKVLIPENDARPPLGVYFGRILGGVRHVKGRGGVEEFSLKKRRYLGPTSMDAELSFIMTNLAQVEKGSVVFDPFVGTGSILLSCALQGAFCVGTDIDIRVLRGRSPNETVWSNFQQQNLRRPELIRSDNSIYPRHYRSGVPLYDAIVTDPPYGIRAGARKSGSRLNKPRPVSDEHRHDHIAQTRPYPVSDVMADLLDVAARTLVMGGRLVYIIPSFSEFDPASDLPHHECLKVVHVCYQPLQTYELGRRMVAMKKIKEYDASKREDYLKNIWKNGPASAEKVANIREKIMEAARMKPDYEERLAYRKQKRKAHREAKKRAKLAQSKQSSIVE